MHYYNNYINIYVMRAKKKISLFVCLNYISGCLININVNNVFFQVILLIPKLRFFPVNIFKKIKNEIIYIRRLEKGNTIGSF